MPARSDSWNEPIAGKLGAGSTGVRSWTATANSAFGWQRPIRFRAQFVTSRLRAVGANARAFVRKFMAINPGIRTALATRERDIYPAKRLSRRTKAGLLIVTVMHDNHVPSC